MRGLTRLSRSKSLISESRDQRVELAQRVLGSRFQFRAVSDSTQWGCLKSQTGEEQKTKIFASLYGLKEVFQEKNVLKLIQEGRRLLILCFLCLCHRFSHNYFLWYCQKYPNDKYNFSCLFFIE